LIDWSKRKENLFESQKSEQSLKRKFPFHSKVGVICGSDMNQKLNVAVTKTAHARVPKIEEG
jgi:hypothetical protein